MSDTVIQVENLSKCYRIGGSGAHFKYGSLRDSLANAAGAPIRRLRGSPDSHKEENGYIWALKDVSFEVKQGEVLGIIGRNGAGKTTLLKILSRITRPTEGNVRMRGRVGSLLEVGTGFHPELTGRENIYLNGAVLGMKRAEIDAKFDEIIDFAEIEQFLDTPVKYYSSGMYMRLAFAVAAHLEPEILLVDEVLAVGDAAFQKKCLGKMGDISKEGRTVLFVSHQMNAIRELCPMSIWLNSGKLVLINESSTVISSYLHSVQIKNEWTAKEGIYINPNPFFYPQRFCIINKSFEPIIEEITASTPFGILIEGIVERPNIALTVGFAIYDFQGILLFWSLHTDIEEENWIIMKKGKNKLVSWVPAHFLNEGDYRVELILSLHYKEWISRPEVNAPSITVRIRGGLSDSPYWIIPRPGILAPILKFNALK